MTNPLPGLIPPGANQIQGLSPLSPAGGTQPARKIEGPDFKQVLMQNINQVNEMQQNAETAVDDLISGKRDDMESVLIAKQKADIAFQMLLQVRNKMMDAYEEVKQIRV